MDNERSSNKKSSFKKRPLRHEKKGGKELERRKRSDLRGVLRNTIRRVKRLIRGLGKESQGKKKMEETKKEKAGWMQSRLSGGEHTGQQSILKTTGKKTEEREKVTKGEL